MVADRQYRSWGRNEDGSQFVVGLTIGELISQLTQYHETDEVCMVIDSYEGLLGKSRYVERGADGQVWIHGFVLDESIAGGKTPPKLMKEII